MSEKNSKTLSLKGLANRLRGVKHPFIWVVVTIYVALSIFGISGSSLGMYSRDSNSLVTSERIGKPRPIRSDEWIVNTQMTIAQEETGYPRVNPNIGGGEDVSVILDVPYKEWSSLFKPQNLAFLILPIKAAFALKWWYSIVLMLLSTYLISYFFLKKRSDARVLSALLAVSTTFTPMLIWWHQSTTTISLSIAYLMIIANLFVRSFDAEKKRKPLLSKQNILLTIAVTYSLACWIFLMYPPFQIASLWGFVFVLVGYLINQSRRYGSSLRSKLTETSLRLLPYVISTVGALLAFVLFIKTRSDVIHIIQSTSYPGKRNIMPGDMAYRELIMGSYDYALQSGSRAVGLGGVASNQSEFSSFGPWWMFIFILMPMLILSSLKGKLKQINWQAVTILFGSVAVLIRVFSSFGAVFYKPTLLHLVPHNRLKIIFIILGLFGLIIWMAKTEESDKEAWTKPTYNIAAILLSVAMFLTIFIIGLNLKDIIPGYITHVKAELTIVSVIVASCLYLALTKKFKAMMIVITLFTLASSVFVNPLQRGLGELDPSSTNFIATRNRISQLIEPGDLVIENSTIKQESFSELMQRKSITAVYSYPQLNLWSSIEQKDPSIYNRYAHVNTKLDSPAGTNPYIKLDAADSLSIHSDICGLKRIDFGGQKVTKIVSSSVLESPCADKLGVVYFMNVNLYVYKVV